MLTVEKIDAAATFAAMRTEWNALLAASASDCPFLSWEWLHTWWQYLAEDRRLCLLAVRRDCELLAIAPLALRPPRVHRLLPFAALEFLGTGSVGSDYLDVIVRRGAERESLAALTTSLANARYTLEFTQVAAHASAATELAQRLARNGWTLARRSAEVCPYIDLVGHDFASYLASLGQAHRYNFGRRLRNLRKHFEVRFERAVSEHERRQALTLLLDLHRARWRDRGGTNAFHTDALVAFHESWSALALANDWLRLYVLRLDGRPAAALYGFHYHGVFYFYQSGLDEAYARHSVGLVTMGLAIERAIEEGARGYDLLHGEEPYKYLWAQTAHRLDRLELYPPQALGVVYRQVAEWRERMKQIARRWFPAAAAEKAAHMPPRSGVGRHVA